MDTREVVKINNKVRELRAIAKLAAERADGIVQYHRLLEEFEAAIDNHAPQTDINLLRKRLNNARVRITPWLNEEKSA